MSWPLIGAGAGVLVVAAVAIWVARLFGKIDAARESALAAETARAEEERLRLEVEAELEQVSEHLREAAEEHAEFRRRAKKRLADAHEDARELEAELAELATPGALRERLDRIMRRTEAIP